MKPIKPRICKIKDMNGAVCGVSFLPRSSLQVACSPLCAIHKIAHDKAKKAEKAASEQRIALRKAKERIKSRGEWTEDAQTAFNAFIRSRDSGLPCVSCGRHHQGQYHAGHYRTVGANPELRFCELNVHKQCAPCNDHLHGNLINYRIELIKRIGQDKVDWLEGPHEPKHYSIDDLKEIKAEYKRLLKEISKAIRAPLSAEI